MSKRYEKIKLGQNAEMKNKYLHRGYGGKLALERTEHQNQLSAKCWNNCRKVCFLVWESCFARNSSTLSITMINRRGEFLVQIHELINLVSIYSDSSLFLYVVLCGMICVFDYEMYWHKESLVNKVCGKCRENMVRSPDGAETFLFTITNWTPPSPQPIQYW